MKLLQNIAAASCLIFLSGMNASAQETIKVKVCQNAPLLSFTHKAPTFTSWGFVIT